MNPEEFKASTSGSCRKTLLGYWAFIPNPLPPILSFSKKTIFLLSEADRILGELSGTGRLLPNPYLLISPYIRREAVSSSRIEGTQASLSDLFFFEAAENEEPKVPDVKEVRNYVTAMEHGIQLLKKLPISTRLILNIHKLLMTGVRGGEIARGEYRTSQNWIGFPGSKLDEATFVPPPPEELAGLLSNLEKYLNSDSGEPPLIRCALSHYQFEAVHPFRDGNGRIGRLLIIFYLYNKGFLSQPLLYLSAFFEKNRNEYYTRLLAVSQKGDWEAWINFFLTGVATQCKDALEDSKKIITLNAEYKKLLGEKKKVPESAHRLTDEIFLNPVISISRLSKSWKMPFNSVKAGVNRLIELGILKEITKRRRNRLFVAPKLMKLLT